jgi:hypothetical protein
MAARSDAARRAAAAVNRIVPANAASDSARSANADVPNARVQPRRRT